MFVVFDIFSLKFIIFLIYELPEQFLCTPLNSTNLTALFEGVTAQSTEVGEA